MPATCCVEGWATTGTTTPLDLVRLVGAPLALVSWWGFVAGLETRPEFVMAGLCVLWRVLQCTMQSKLWGVFLLAVLSAGCGQQKETTKGLLHKQKTLPGPGWGKRLLEVTYNQFDSIVARITQGG